MDKYYIEGPLTYITPMAESFGKFSRKKSEIPKLFLEYHEARFHREAVALPHLYKFERISLISIKVFNNENKKNANFKKKLFLRVICLSFFKDKPF